MRCAIYARKSNDDNDKSREDKSVARQVAHAKEFIRNKGWQPAAEGHIYTDDGVSGADFKRDGLLHMLISLREFDVIVMSEQSRLGREMSQMSGVIARIVNRNVRIFFYLDGKELRYESAVDKFMVSAVSFANEMERELASQRSRDASLKRARELRSSGGRIYGYDNIWRLADGSEQLAPAGGQKPAGAQTLYRINEEEAEVVRAIFRAYADGHGQRSIAFALNGAPKHAELRRRYFGGKRPAPPRGNASYWSPNTLHDLLRNPRYEGFVLFGAMRNRLALGEGPRRVRGEEQLFPAPELRIVDERLAQAVKSRAARMRSEYLRTTGGNLGGRPDTGRASRFLLSGLMRCEVCGSSMIVASHGSGSGAKVRQVRHYACNFRVNRGPTACSNHLRLRLEAVDAQLLTAIEQRVLKPEVTRVALRHAAEVIRNRIASQPDEGAKLRQALAKIERERDRLVEAVAKGRGEPAAIIAAIAEREKRIAGLEKEIARLESSPLLDQLSDKRLERELTECAAQWREVLAGNPSEARQALRTLMAGPIWFSVQPTGYQLRGTTRLGALLFGENGVEKQPALSWCREGESNPHGVATGGF